MDKKFSWKRLTITILIVLVASGTVGGGTWYVMNLAAQKQKIESDRQIQALEKQINNVQLKDTNTIENPAETTTNQQLKPAESSEVVATEFMENFLASAPPRNVNGKEALKAKTYLSEQLQKEIETKSPSSINGGIALIMGIQDIPESFLVNKPTDSNTSSKAVVNLDFGGTKINKTFTLSIVNNSWKITGIN